MSTGHFLLFKKYNLSLVTDTNIVICKLMESGIYESNGNCVAH